MYLDNRLIAMLDVLGFASRIRTPEGLRQTTTQYADLIAEAKGHMFSPAGVQGTPNRPEPNFEYGQFVFDTLVLVSYPIDVNSTYRFIFAAILLMEQFFSARFPLRGSIARGDFCTEEKTQIFLSDAFKRLKIDEDNQQWSGCTVLPEVEDVVVTSLLGSSPDTTAAVGLPRSSPVHRVVVPQKQQESPPALRWCLNWSHFLSPSDIAAGLQFMESDKTKRNNTAQYVQLIQSFNDDSQNLPPAFSPAKSVKLMKARSGLRVKFEDEIGNGVEPGCSSWNITAS